MPSLLLADGQLATTSTALVTLGTFEELVSITLVNNIQLSQTVILTLTRVGSTARTIARAVLKKNASLYIVGLPLGASDVLAGQTDNANAVDYVVMQSGGPFAIYARDDSGAPTGTASISVSLPQSFAIEEALMTLNGFLEEIRDVAVKIA